MMNIDKIIGLSGVGTVFIASAVEMHQAWRALPTGISTHGGRDEYGPYIG
jgi:hypothetical protein